MNYNYHQDTWKSKGSIKSESIGTLAFFVLSLYCIVQHLFTYNFVVGNVPYIPLMAGSFLYASYFLAISFFIRISRGSLLLNNEIAIPSLFFALAILIVLLGDEKARSYGIQDNITQLNLFYLGGSILAFIVGYSMMQVGRFKQHIIVGFVLLVINVLVNINSTYFRLNLNIINSDQEGIYLMLGDTFGLWPLLSGAVVKKRFSRLIIVLVALFCLTMLNTRTSLYAFIMAIPFLFRLKLGRAGILMAIIVSALIFLAPMLQSQENLIGRMYGSIFSGEDSSMKSRLIQFDVGLTALAEHWFIGDYAGQVRDFGEYGAYMHNILSYWSQFGLIPFLLIISIWVRATRRAFRHINSSNNWEDPDSLFFVLALVYFGVEVFASRSYLYFMAWLVLGMSATPRYDRPDQHSPENIGITDET